MVTSTDWRDHFRPVFDAREAWMAEPSPANKARWDAALRIYQSRYDCSVCVSKSHCYCTLDTSGEVGSAPERHSDAHDTTTHFDSGDTTMPLKSYEQHIADCGGDLNEARARFHAETHNSRRPNNVASVRSDAVEEAERANRLKNLTAWCRTDEERNKVLRSVAEREAREKERAAFRDQRSRFDAAGPKCECGGLLMEDDGEKCATCRTAEAERSLKKRSANAWKKPLRATNQRSAGTVGYHPTDDDGDAA